MLQIQQLSKRYESVTAVAQLDLEIHEAEFFTLLGPSGCGKTTTLRCIGGLEKPDSGIITLRDRIIVDSSRRVFLPPERRNMGMVFQSYALWPHMTVFENVAYPLKLRRVSRAQIREKVQDSLRLVGLEHLSDRQTPQLSGGQQQRVALARALVFSPDVLLLDEPLSNLDAILRDEMRRQLKDLQSRVGVTTIFVTHDQVEALSLSDRIAIMNEGRVEQLGTPKEVYTSPQTPFTQSFLGKILSVDARVTSLQDGELQLAIEGVDKARLVVPRNGEGAKAAAGIREGDAVLLSIRPEQIRVSDAVLQDRPNVVPVRVRSALFIGDRSEYVVELGAATRVVALPANELFTAGDMAYLEFPEEALSVWPK